MAVLFPTKKHHLSALFCGLCLLLAGCVHVFETVALDAVLDEKSSSCKSSLGAYFLPKRLISIRIDQKGPAADHTTYELDFGYRLSSGADDTNTNKLPYRTVADRKQQYCIDYFGSAFAEDHINVKRNGEQLLERVFSNPQDKSVDIAKSITDAGGALAASLLSQGAGARAFVESGKPDPGKLARIAEFEFDPFDLQEITAVNHALKGFGYCVFLKRNRDPFIPHWMDDQCPGVSGPWMQGETLPIGYGSDIKAAPAQVGKPKPFEGILYKPLLTHTLVIMKKDDPGSSLPWKIWDTRRLQMPNAAPPFLLEIKRAAFTTRKTDILFVDGLLNDVFVDKGSELDAFVNIPVRVIEVLVQVPVQSLTLATNRAKNQEALIKVNQQTIELLADIQTSKAKQQELVGGLSAEQMVLLAQFQQKTGLPISRSATPEERSLAISSCLQNARDIVQGDPGVFCDRAVNGG